MRCPPNYNQMMLFFIIRMTTHAFKIKSNLQNKRIFMTQNPFCIDI